MSGTAIALVLVSALLHATWNLFGKASGDRWAFFFGQGLATFVFYAPVLVWLWPTIHFEPIGWAWIAASAATHVGYAVYLLKAYDAGDLSVAYPLSRTAPVLVVVWDLLTVRGQLTAAGVSGVMLSGIGAIVLQLPALRSRGARAVLGENVIRYALATALFIAVFTIIDKRGVVHVHPFAFLYFTGVGEFSCIGAYIGGGAFVRAAGELRTNTSRLLFTAVVGPFSYLLILWVLTSAPASYVLGLRQTSIVFGVVLGRIVLGEGETRYRLAGAAIIAAGSILIAAAG